MLNDCSLGKGAERSPVFDRTMASITKQVSQADNVQKELEQEQKLLDVTAAEVSVLRQSMDNVMLKQQQQESQIDIKRASIEKILEELKKKIEALLGMRKVQKDKRLRKDCVDMRKILRCRDGSVESKIHAICDTLSGMLGREIKPKVVPKISTHNHSEHVPTPHLNFSEIQSEDAQRVHSLEEKVFEYPWPLPDVMDMIKKSKGIKCSHGDVLAAYAFFNSLKIKGSKRMDLINFAVSPERSRHGIGTQLMDQVIKRALRDGYTEITFCIRERNLHGQLFLKRMGFKVVSQEQGQYDETDEDSYVFQYKIEDGQKEASKKKDRQKTA
ncbi:hypothetical protein A2635_01635 [Candidatus Peribacteria bacterium RIFCSPHIGHO2_01_FULL_51_9]|nr:MAG: hypothetical protein A2635_01635 [Candidatus Peribacteria bacterium RIFCSPHIGHO2_01_FULL_51_9]